MVRRLSVDAGEKDWTDGPEGWCAVSTRGFVVVNAKKKGTVEKWVHVLAHGLLHLALGHDKLPRDVDPGDGFKQRAWRTACCLYAGKFLDELKVGQRPEDLPTYEMPANATEEWLFRQFLSDDAIPDVCGVWAPGAQSRISCPLMKIRIVTTRRRIIPPCSPRAWPTP